MNKKSLFGTVILILLILVVGGGLSVVLLRTGPEVAPVEKSSPPKIVQTIPLVPHTRSIAVSTFGSVIPSKKVVIKPQVSG
jgi:hypothetical protein